MKYLGVGYTLILLITVTFVAVALLNNYFDSTVASDVVMNSYPDGRNMILNFENHTSFPNLAPSDLSLKADPCTQCDFFSNFSMLQFQVSIAAPQNETVSNPIVETFIEDQAGYIVGYGDTMSDRAPFWQPMPSENKVFSSAPVTIIFGYNVPSVLRGQVLQVHVWWFENGIYWLIGMTTFAVKTFPSPNLIEAPRILLFFFAFSTIPVGTFVPSPWKKKLETYLLDHRRILLVVMVASLFLSGIYWNLVCKVFCFI